MRHEVRQEVRRGLLTLIMLFALTGLAALDLPREARALLLAALAAAALALAVLDGGSAPPGAVAIAL